jgi:hypothetical protein
MLRWCLRTLPRVWENVVATGSVSSTTASGLAVVSSPPSSAWVKNDAFSRMWARWVFSCLSFFRAYQPALALEKRHLES